MKKIIFTVTNDLRYDQRMQRICGSLAANGYAVTLTGRRLKNSLPLPPRSWKEKRIRCWFNSGKLFYAEYNIRLFFWLLFQKTDAVCAIDLDTIMPVYWATRIKKAKRIYDAHELFTELKEVITRPGIHRFWQRVERKYVPRFPFSYTVSAGIAEEFKKKYGKAFDVIRNMPLPDAHHPGIRQDGFILYQGAVNEGRCFEQLIPAMKQVNRKLVICGDGNFMVKLKELIRIHQVEDKIEIRGMLAPEELKQAAEGAAVGVAIAEKEGLNQWLALPNKFFDYVQMGLPQLTMDYPEYRVMNREQEVAVLIEKPDAERISEALNKMLSDSVLYNRLLTGCHAAATVWNWNSEETKLLAFYTKIFSA